MRTNLMLLGSPRGPTMNDSDASRPLPSADIGDTDDWNSPNCSGMPDTTPVVVLSCSPAGSGRGPSE